MFLRLGQFCLILTLCRSSSGFSCGWINFKFREYHGIYLRMLREMDSGITGDTGDVNIFDHHWRAWFIRHTHSKPEKQVWLVVQTLEEISELLSEAYSAPWSRKQLDELSSVLNNQAVKLSSCVTVRMRKNSRLPLFFKRLRDHIQNNMGDHINTWEQIRREVLKLLSLLELFPALRPNQFLADQSQ